MHEECIQPLGAIKEIYTVTSHKGISISWQNITMHSSKIRGEIIIWKTKISGRTPAKITFWQRLSWCVVWVAVYNIQFKKSRASSSSDEHLQWTPSSFLLLVQKDPTYSLSKSPQKSANRWQHPRHTPWLHQLRTVIRSPTCLPRLTQKPDESISSFTSRVEQVQQRTCIRGLGHFWLSISFQIQNNQKDIESVTTE